MTIYYLCPTDPATVTSGGTRKLGDHVAILNEHGFDAAMVLGTDYADMQFAPTDLVVVPEVWGAILKAITPGVRRVGFAQNGYLLDMATFPDFPHPYVDCDELVAVLTESDHTSELVHLRCPELQVPVIRTHSSAVGRMGKTRDGMRYGGGNRRRAVAYFKYKHDAQNEAIFDGLELPEGWHLECLSGRTDEQIEEALRGAAVFVAPNAAEGLCAPTQEAMICGARIVGWPGGPSKFAHWGDVPDWSWRIREVDVALGELTGGPMEYLEERANIVAQDDVEALRQAIVDLCKSIDAVPEAHAQAASEASAYHTAHYSRPAEIAELVEIFGELVEMRPPARRSAPAHREPLKRLRIGIGCESVGSAQYTQRAQTPAEGLRRLGHHVWTSAFSFHGDVITVPKVDDRKVLALVEAGKQVPSVAPPPQVMIVRLPDQDETASIESARSVGQLVFFDMDDDAWHLPEWNAGHRYLKRDGVWLDRDPDLKRREDVRSTDLAVLERNIAACDGVLCSTPGVAEAVREAVPGVRTFICRNGIDARLYYWPRRVVEHVPRLRVGWIGSTAGQNHGGLLEVLDELADLLATHNCEFWHLGAGTDDPPIGNFLPKGWEIPVRAVPAADNKLLPWLLSEIDVGLIARRQHRFTNAQSNVTGLAYAAAGVPFVASRAPEYELLENQGVGITYAHPHLGDELGELLADGELRAILREHGREVAMLHHDPATVAKQYLEAFEAVR